VNPQDPLADLHPLRLPAEISWWPLAPGWWLVICAVALLLAALAYWWHKYRQRTAYRRAALDQLTKINTLEEQDAWLTQTNALLKSVAVYAFPARDIAALSGGPWLAFLNGSCGSSKHGTLFPESFASAVYSPVPAALKKDQLQQASRHWITQHRSVL
jgi:hypothetical protein